MRIGQIVQLSAVVVALAGAACFPAAKADTQVSNSVARCGNKGPYYGRTDGYCLDTDTKAPGVMLNGTFDKLFNSPLYVSVDEDFLGDRTIATSADTDGGPWFGADTAQSAGPVLVDDAKDGVIQLALDNGSEVGNMTLYWGDVQSIDSDAEPFCIFRVQIPQVNASADTVSWGFVDAHNALIDSSTHNAYLSVAGADLVLDTASDDNSTDVNNTGTGVTLTAATWYEFLVSMNSMHGVTASDADGASATDVHFFYRSTLGGDWTQLNAGTTHKFGAGVQAQPFVQVEKTTGTTTPSVKVDRIACSWERQP